MNRELIKEVMSVARRLDEKNLVNTFEGNISAREGDKIYITPTTRNKALLTEEMIAVIDAKGNQIGGNCKPTSELPMHRMTYTLRDNIGGVVHCHPTFMTAPARSGRNICSCGYCSAGESWCTGSGRDGHGCHE